LISREKTEKIDNLPRLYPNENNSACHTGSDDASWFSQWGMACDENPWLEMKKLKGGLHPYCTLCRKWATQDHLRAPRCRGTNRHSQLLKRLLAQPAHLHQGPANTEIREVHMPKSCHVGMHPVPFPSQDRNSKSMPIPSSDEMQRIKVELDELALLKQRADQSRNKYEMQRDETLRKVKVLFPNLKSVVEEWTIVS